MSSTFPTLSSCGSDSFRCGAAHKRSPHRRPTHVCSKPSPAKPLLVIAEGLTPYRQAVDGLALLRRLTEYFPRMEMLFDGYGRHGVRFLQRYGCVKVSGAQTDWRINDPRAIERAVPGLILDAELWVHGRAGD